MAVLFSFRQDNTVACTNTAAQMAITLPQRHGATTIWTYKVLMLSWVDTRQARQTFIA